MKSIDGLPGEISVAIIAEGSPKDTLRHHVLGSAHAKEFLLRVFSETFPNPIFSRSMWPPAYTDNCPGISFSDATSWHKVHKSGFQRGLILAHRQVWESFVKHYEDTRSDISSYASPKIIIFENDAMEIDPAAPDIAYQSVTNMTSDLHFLGHCYDREPLKKPPQCTHAYALTVRGAKVLLANMDWCAQKMGGALDTQFQYLGENGIIKWSAVSASNPYGISDDYIQEKAFVDGFTVEWGNQAGGLFHQVTFDDIVECVENGVYKRKWPQKSVYLFQNGSFHEFQDVHTFAAMGHDFDDVVVISHWQLQRNIGDMVPSLLE